MTSYRNNHKFHLSLPSPNDGEKVNENYFLTTSNGSKKKFFHHKNLCPGGKNCQNYKVITELELEMQKLVRTVKQLKKINEYLIFSINQKDCMYKIMLNGKESRKPANHYFNKKIIEEEVEKPSRIKPTKTVINAEKAPTPKEPSTHRSSNEEEHIIFNTGPEQGESLETSQDIQRRDKKTSTISYQKNDKNLTRFSDAKVKVESKFSSTENGLNTHSNEKHPSILRKFQTNADLPQPSLNLDDQKSGRNHPSQQIKIIHNPYEEIVEFSLRNQKHKLLGAGVSFLSLSDERLREMPNNPSLVELYQLTLSDDLFINEFQTSEKDDLIQYCDVIGTVIKDYNSLIDLIIRIKHFMAASVELVSSVLLEDSTSVLIRNTCRILDCERVSLFIHDRYTDMLVVHSAEGLKKNQIKIPKDKGIVGAVFMKGEKLKIDEPYQDHRFNKEVDKMTNFRTRNIICYPLIDNDGDIFGAIQAINKRKGCFDTNDEELLSIFSKQASSILKNMMNMDANTLQLSRMKKVTEYDIQIATVTDILEFVSITEKIVEDIFSDSVERSSQILFYINDYLYDPKKDKVIYQKELGIVNYVCEKKECHGCPNTINCMYYNPLVDLNASDSMITYPIIEKDKGSIEGVIQVMTCTRISEKSQKPKENEVMVLHILGKCFSGWCRRNEKLLKEIKKRKFK